MASADEKDGPDAVTAEPTLAAGEDSQESVRRQREALTDAVDGELDERPVLRDGKRPGEDSAQ